MNKNYSFLSHANVFSAGLFIALGLIHLLPEAEHSFKEYFEHQEKEVHSG